MSSNKLSNNQKNWKKNDTVSIRITDVGQNGEGIGRTEDGYTLFTKNTVPGDLAEIRIIKTQKTYGFGRLMRLIEPSKDRTEPFCPIAGKCGGCQLQHMTYEAELRLKENKVRNDLERIGGILTERKTIAAVGQENTHVPAELREAGADGDSKRREGAAVMMEPIVGMDRSIRYRNKAQFPIGADENGNPIAGFYAGHSHRIIPCEDCMLGVEENRIILSAVLEWMKEQGVPAYNEETGKGVVRHVLIRKGFATGEIIVCLILNARELLHKEALIGKLSAVKGVVGITISSNTKKTNVIMNAPVRTVWGAGEIVDILSSENFDIHVRYRISPASFYQVNPVQTEKIYQKVLELADLSGNETVMDLYCGIGTISLFLAAKAAKVIGVEIVPEAIEDAKKNAAMNEIGNADFYVGKAEEVVPDLYAKGAKADVVVVDPPRKGCNEKLLDTILKMDPERIVYVSCDPATLARDLKFLTANGYELTFVQPYDQFCHTVHIETVVLLTRNT
uniref:23S rRNA (uracil(1939)-C(5))-methyltransferase RlmD n=1 Tax=Eubacterium cellulosolvens TaxID=29322 RepID=UPI000686A377|nr:23S rRNA (uracil(1939)-C(5))-methyltransferase RlmD [[Eubacterium] cellulosolvens]